MLYFCDQLIGRQLEIQACQRFRINFLLPQDEKDDLIFIFFEDRVGFLQKLSLLFSLPLVEGSLDLFYYAGGKTEADSLIEGIMVLDFLHLEALLDQGIRMLLDKCEGNLVSYLAKVPPDLVSVKVVADDPIGLDA